MANVYGTSIKLFDDVGDKLYPESGPCYKKN